MTEYLIHFKVLWCNCITVLSVIDRNEQYDFVLCGCYGLFLIQVRKKTVTLIAKAEEETFPR